MNFSKLYDVSVTLSADLVVWEGDPSVQIEKLGDMSQGSDCNMTRLTLGAHNGTHMDAPLHFIKDATGIALDVLWLVEDSAVKEYLGRDTVVCKQGIMLDLTAEGGLDMSKGKNVGLGRLREAVGKNNSGEAFSFAMLPGSAAKISVAHRVANDDTFAEVKQVAML